MKPVAFVVSLALSAGAAVAQSVFVDFNTVSGSGAGAPNSAYTAATSAFGVWNAVTPALSPSTLSLLGVSGGLSGISMTHLASHGAFQGAYGSGEFGKLMADGAFAFGASGMISLDVNGVDPGAYLLYVYAGLPPATAYYTQNGQQVPHPQQVSVRINSTSVGYANLGGATADGTLAASTNYAMFRVNVPAGNPTLQIDVFGDVNNANARIACNGFQLVRWPSNIIYVRPGGSGDKTGTSWGNAIDSLTGALNHAEASNGHITQVWVAAGTYKPTTGADRTLSFRMRENVAVYGGFAGSETAVDQRVPGSNISSLSGDIGTPRVDDDNSHHVVTFNDVGRASVLDGFTIIGGNADGTGVHAYGGGILCDQSAPTIRRCVVWSNTASSFGGGIAMLSPRTGIATLVDRCVIRHNTASVVSAGGVGISNHVAGATPLINFASCVFAGNHAHLAGGGIQIIGASAILRQCALTGNTASIENGGAIRAFGATASPFIRLENCTLAGNTAPAAGGVSAESVSITVNNSILWSNTAATGTLLQKQLTATGPGPTANYCIIQGHSAAAPLGTDNLNLNPLFADADGPDNILGTLDDDLRPTDASPAIDSGSNDLAPVDIGDLDQDASTLEDVPFDLAGAPRFVDHTGAAPIIDRGAFENQTPPSCPADFNGDGFLDFFDYDDFVSCFEGVACPPAKTADFNGDDFVDFFDYDDFVTAFTQGC